MMMRKSRRARKISSIRVILFGNTQFNIDLDENEKIKKSEHVKLNIINAIHNQKKVKTKKAKKLREKKEVEKTESNEQNDSIFDFGFFDDISNYGSDSFEAYDENDDSHYLFI